MAESDSDNTNSNKIEKGRRRSNLTVEEKTMIYYVFEGLRAREQHMSVGEVVTLCSILTKVSETSVYRAIKNENEGNEPKPETRGRKRKVIEIRQLFAIHLCQMTKPCVVPGCKTGKRKSQEKISVFKVPSNTEAREKWEHAIRGVSKFRSVFFVCEKHFKESEVERKYVRYFGDVKIAEYKFQHPRLVPSAIPSIFSENEGNVNCNQEPEVENSKPEQEQDMTNTKKRKSTTSQPETPHNPKLAKTTDAPDHVEIAINHAEEIKMEIIDEPVCSTSEIKLETFEDIEECTENQCKTSNFVQPEKNAKSEPELPHNQKLTKTTDALDTEIINHADVLKMEIIDEPLCSTSEIKLETEEDIKSHWKSDEHSNPLTSNFVQMKIEKPEEDKDNLDEANPVSPKFVDVKEECS